MISNRITHKDGTSEAFNFFDSINRIKRLQSIIINMNLNAPEHQPPVAREISVVEFASDKMFSDPDATIAGRLNQRT
jgi:hypothetical protein